MASLGGFSCRPHSLVVPVFVFGVFLSVAAVLCLLPLLLLGVTRLLLSLLWCVCSACPRTPAVFPLRVMQLAALLGFHSWLTLVGCPTPAVMVSHGFWGCLSTDVLLPPLSFFFVTAQLPLRGSAPLPGELACLTPACWSTPRVGLEGSCCVLFLRACSVRCFVCCGFPYGFRVTGGLSSASLVTWVGLQPFPSFSGLLLLRLLAGVVGVLHPVSGCSS